VDQDQDLGLAMGGRVGVLDELEDDGLEVQMIDRGGLQLTSQLDVVLLVAFLEDKLRQITLGRDVLGLDLLVHLLEADNDESENLLLLLVDGVLLGDLEVVPVFERVDDFLHVLGQEEGEEWGELVLGDLESLDEDLGEEDDALATEEQGVQSLVLSAFAIGLVAVSRLRVMGGAVQVASLLRQRTGNLEGLGAIVIPLELVLIALLKHRELPLKRHGLKETIAILVVGVRSLDLRHSVGHVEHVRVLRLRLRLLSLLAGIGGDLGDGLLELDGVGALGDTAEWVRVLVVFGILRAIGFTGVVGFSRTVGLSGDSLVF